MIKYFAGALVGGLLGYFVLYKLIGCSGGSCPVTSNVYVSVIYGIIFGVLFAAIITVPAKTNVPAETSQPIDVQYRKITPEEAKNRIDSGDDIIIVDVRTGEEYEQRHIQNAILIPNETITTDAKPALLPDYDAEILIYCRSGNRSAQAAKKLIALGYTNVYDFGGIIDWPYETETVY